MIQSMARHVVEIFSRIWCPRKNLFWHSWTNRGRREIRCWASSLAIILYIVFNIAMGRQSFIRCRSTFLGMSLRTPSLNPRYSWPISQKSNRMSKKSFSIKCQQLWNTSDLRPSMLGDLPFAMSLTLCHNSFLVGIHSRFLMSYSDRSWMTVARMEWSTTCCGYLFWWSFPNRTL